MSSKETKESRPANPQIEADATRDTFQQAVRRTVYFSYICAVACFAFGFISYPYLQEFKPTLKLIDNVWPRIVVSVVPFFLLGKFLKRSKISDQAKLLFWSAMQGIIFSATSMINVWPIALAGHPQVMLHVNGINTQYAMSAMLVVCAPKKILHYWAIIFVLATTLPILTVSYFLNDPMIFKIVLNDSLNGIFAAFMCSLFIGKVYAQVALLESQRRSEASTYLGKEIHSAIFEDKKELLEERLVSGFVMSLDIRDSSKLTREYGTRWSSFINEWMGIAPEIVNHKRGKVVKTAGDSLLITFGVFDEQVDLSDIPDLQLEVANAEERRFHDLTSDALACAELLVNRFQDLAKKHFPETAIRIGVGIDRGKIRTGVRGNDVRKELDIWGDPVNCAARLEAYSKSLTPDFNPHSSLLVLSPYAVDYLKSFEGFVKVDTKSEIKDFSGIRWVLVREYFSKTISTEKAA